MAQPPDEIRRKIRQTLDELNQAENDPALDAAAKSAVVDRLSSPTAEGWLNGSPRGGRAEERDQELALWSAFPDYQRVFDRVVIDGSTAAVQWRMTGSSEDLGIELDLTGASIFEFDEHGLIDRFWMFFHDPLAT